MQRTLCDVVKAKLQGEEEMNLQKLWLGFPLICFGILLVGYGLFTNDWLPIKLFFWLLLALIIFVIIFTLLNVLVKYSVYMANRNKKITPPFRKVKSKSFIKKRRKAS